MLAGRERLAVCTEVAVSLKEGVADAVRICLSAVKLATSSPKSD